MFRMLICDEGHKVKNRHASAHEAVAKLDAPHMWVLFATPMINRVTDLRGLYPDLGSQIANHRKYTWPREVSTSARVSSLKTVLSRPSSILGRRTRTVVHMIL